MIVRETRGARHYRLERDYQYMSPTSFHQPLPDNAALDTVDGPAAVAALAARCSESTVPRINAKQFAPTVFVVPADQPRVPVLAGTWAPKRAIFQVYGVPVDVDAYLAIYTQKAALGDTDLSCVVVQPDYVSWDGLLHGREWGMWRLKPTTQAEQDATGCRLKLNDQGCYRIVGTAESTGYTRQRPATGKAEPGWNPAWGWYNYGQAPADDRLDQLETFELRSGLMLMSASGLALGPFTLTHEDVERGEIDHAISFGIGADLIRPGARWPAQASDGGQAGAPLQEGMRLRFPAALDFAPYGLSPLALMWCRAVQKYGGFPVDRSNVGGILASGAEWGVEASYPRVPRGAKGELLPFHAYPGSTAYDAQGAVPWNQLQLCATGTPAVPIPTS